MGSSLEHRQLTAASTFSCWFIPRCGPSINYISTLNPRFAATPVIQNQEILTDRQVLFKDTHAYPDLQLYLSMEPVTGGICLLFLLFLLPPALGVILLVPLAFYLRKHPRPSQASRLAGKQGRKSHPIAALPPASSGPTDPKSALGPAGSATSPEAVPKTDLGSTAPGASAQASPKPAAGATGSDLSPSVADKPASAPNGPTRASTKNL